MAGVTLSALSGVVKRIRFITGREGTIVVRNPQRGYWIVVADVVCAAIAACGQNSKARSFVEQGNTKAKLGQFQKAVA